MPSSAREKKLMLSGEFDKPNDLLGYMNFLIELKFDRVASRLEFFFFNDTATTEIYTLSLHDALPICSRFSSNNTQPQNMHVDLEYFIGSTSTICGCIRNNFFWLQSYTNNWRIHVFII